MHPDLAAGLGQGVIAGKNRAPVAIAAQRFAGKETGAAKGAQVATFAAPVLRAQTLRGVFNHGQMAVPGGNRVDGIHVGALAIQAHRHDGAGARRNGRLDACSVDQARIRLDIHKHRTPPQQNNHLGRGGKGERRGDHFVAALQAQRHQADEQRLGAAGNGDAMPGARALRQRRLQLGHFRPHDVLAVIQHALHAGVDAALQRRVLGFEVDEIHAVGIPYAGIWVTWLPSSR